MKAQLIILRPGTVKCRIKPKRDFGRWPFIINGKVVGKGFIITLNGCNIMPAGTWFQTIREALLAIRVLERSKGDSTRFWKLLNRCTGATQRHREELRILYSELATDYITGKNNGRST